jgi:hypothetical protein
MQIDAVTTHRKLAAILAADAASYSRLMADDEAATLRSVNDRQERVYGFSATTLPSFQI